jgi:hypothetical protein
MNIFHALFQYNFKGKCLQVALHVSSSLQRLYWIQTTETILSDLGCHFEQWFLEEPPLPSLISDFRMALSVLGYLQEVILIMPRTHSSTHIHSPCNSYTFMESSDGGGSLPISWARCAVLSSINFYTVWTIPLCHAYLLASAEKLFLKFFFSF